MTLIEHDYEQTPSRNNLYNIINFEFAVVTESVVMSKKIFSKGQSTYQYNTKEDKIKLYI